MIRLQRIGRKHEPAYRLVLTDSKNSTKSGRFLEILGNYDSRRGEKAELKSERITHWMSKGAKMSDTVHNLLIDKKIITGKKINKLPKKKAIKSVDNSQQSIEKTKETNPESGVEAPIESSSAQEIVEAPEDVAKEAAAEETGIIEEAPVESA